MPDAGLVSIEHPQLWISTSDYSSGLLCALDRTTRELRTSLLLLSGDTVLDWHGSQLVGLDFGSARDAITWIELGASPHQLRSLSSVFSTEMGGGNARSYLALNEHEALVARYNQPTLVRVNRATNSLERMLDLSPFQGNAAHPRPRRAFSADGSYWVVLLRLDATQTNPTEKGLLLRIDPSINGVLDVDPTRDGIQGIELLHANPIGEPEVRGTSVRIACAGNYRALDGGVEEVDLRTRSVRTLVTEEQVNGNIDAAITLDEDRLLLRVASVISSGLGISRTRLVEWSLSRRTAREWLAVDEWTLTEPVLAPEGLVYVGDRGYEPTRRPHGIRIFNASTGIEETTAPLPCALPPYHLRLGAIP